MYLLKLKTLIILLVWTSSTQAHVEKTHYLKGTIGDSPVGVRIDDFAEVSYLKYFYINQNETIILKGNCDSTICSMKRSFIQHDIADEVILETIDIEQLDNHKWEGVWSDGKKVLQVKLSPIDMDSVDHNYSRIKPFTELEPFGYLRTATIILLRDSVTTVGNIELNWMSDSISGITFFQISDGLDPVRLKTVNSWLINQHLTLVDRYFQCGTYGHQGNLQVDVNVRFINNSLLCYSLSIASNCLSDFTTTETVHKTISLNNQELLSLENILLLQQGEPPNVNSNNWFNYRRNEFAPYILNKLKELYPDKFAGNESCNYDDTLTWMRPEWFLTEEGIYFGAKMPGINRKCDNPPWAVIPFKELKDYLNANFDYILAK